MLGQDLHHALVWGGLVKLYKEDKDREEKKKERSLCCSGPRCIQGSSQKNRKKKGRALAEWRSLGITRQLVPCKSLTPCIKLPTINWLEESIEGFMSGKFNGALLEGHDKKIGLPCSKFATISGPVVVLMTWTLKVVAFRVYI